MKAGVLTFSYAGTAGFARQIEREGHFTANLGDNAQTIAARALLKRLGVAEDDIVGVDRDTLADYDGEPVALITNGVFWERSLPMPPQVHPVFVGFNAAEAVVRRHRGWLAGQGTIGCRDVATADHLRAHGIAADVTGCVTMTLPTRAYAPADGRLLIVHGAGAGVLPPEIHDHIPTHLAAGAETIFHRSPVSELPVSRSGRDALDTIEAAMLARYRDTAALVLTSLLHVASPCIGMGIPVILFRRDLDPRFTYLAEKMPVYTPDRAGEIDWNPSLPDVAADRAAIEMRIGAELGRLGVRLR
ncbi:hypothetical protein [Sphingomonas sp. ID0503]|uniref:hypothetical protein n=1 Tax=Sphingomonas sp. ID0503 TaxID=3399691 RepID=UPI003AFA7F0F